MCGSIHRVLADVDKAPTPFTMSDGSRLLLLPYGARVLALATAKSDDNFFWTNPLLSEADTARRLFAEIGWHNTGGDRTWLAPELDIFFADATSTRYRQPLQLDMSNYSVERLAGGIQLSRSMALYLARSNREVDLRLTKWFGPAANPLRHERDLNRIIGSVDYAGYTQRVTLQSLGDTTTSPPRIGIWNLIQFPPGGRMIVPLYSPAIPQSCFGNLPTDRVVIGERLLQVDVNFPGTHKIAVKALALCGRAAYAYCQRDHWNLIVRNFSVDPSGDYVDVQRFDPDDFGYGFQMCRVDEPEFGSFCEMEYHAPALGTPPTPEQSEDVSQLWAFRGSREVINVIAHKLLGTNT